MFAALIGVAEIVGTGVAIVTGQGTDAGAFALEADVLGGTGIAVIALAWHRGVDAARFDVTTVLGTDIVVITRQRVWSGTQSFGTDIAGGAGIEVIARDGVELVETAVVGITPIIGTLILVFTIQGPLANALPATAGIHCGAGIIIIAGDDIVGEDATGFRIADIVGAEVAIVADNFYGSGAATLGADVALGACV
jgi:hypothetical protein